MSGTGVIQKVILNFMGKEWEERRIIIKARKLRAQEYVGWGGLRFQR